ncbi:signal peptide peptidase SppA [Candidatus Woesearchaeota archaeon]|nr:signal peptide peptidase SppA [Candidatus Woesearchaeota archaeon]
MEEPKKKRLMLVFKILIIFVIISFLLSSLISMFIDFEPAGNVALIPVKGIIRVDDVSSFGAETASSEVIIDQIRKAVQNPSIKAIVFDINSPGGSALASQEIANEIKRTNKTTVAVIRELGASGGYWIASAADYSIANEMSITGSIGVFSSYIEFAGLLERYNMTYQRLTGGKHKDLGDPFKPLALEEREILQKKIDKIHDIFIRSVAENRNMPEQKVRQLSTGEFYLGSEALESGLIDAVGGKETAKQYLKQKLNLTEIQFAEYKKEKTLIGLLTGVISPQSYLIGKGIGSELKDLSAKRSIQIFT